MVEVGTVVGVCVGEISVGLGGAIVVGLRDVDGDVDADVGVKGMMVVGVGVNIDGSVAETADDAGEGVEEKELGSVLINLTSSCCFHCFFCISCVSYAFIMLSIICLM